jgi:hypothetical protein
MAFPKQFLRPSAEVAETVRRNRRMIRQVAYLCAESQRELDASYALLRKVEPSMADGRPNRSTQSTEIQPKKTADAADVRLTECP